MTKKEFLSELREALIFELPPELVESNLRYYSSYIDEETDKGRATAEVLSELGSPKLIARTIVDALKSGADGIPGTADDVSFTGVGYGTPAENASARGGAQSGTGAYTQQGAGSYAGRAGSAGSNGYGNSSYGSGTNGSYGGGYQNERPQGTFRRYDMNGGCLGCLVAFLLFFIVLSLIGTLVGGILAFLSPILVPLCMVLLIVWLLKRLDNR